MEKKGYILGQVLGIGNLDRIAAHLLQQVLSKDHNVSRAELDAARIGGKVTIGHLLLNVLGAVGQNARSRVDTDHARVLRASYKHKVAPFADQLELTNQIGQLLESLCFETKRLAEHIKKL